MPRYRIKFHLKGSNGGVKGSILEEVVECANVFEVENIIKARYGDVRIWETARPIDEPIKASSGTSSHSAPKASAGSPQPFAIILLGAVAVIFAIATGAIKPSTETAVNQQSPKASTPQTPAESEPLSQPIPQPEPQATQEFWGAFAISPSTSQSASSTSYPTKDDAEQAAIKTCGQSDCYAFSTFGSGYATLAESDKHWFASHGHSSEADSVNAALSECQSKDPDLNCRVSQTVHF